MDKHALPCQSCKLHPNHCSSCKTISKATLASYARSEIPIYLSERNRAKKAIVFDDLELAKTMDLSCRQAAKRFGCSAQTISRARRALMKNCNATRYEWFHAAHQIAEQDKP